jgi:hypothetical protein
LNPQNGVVRRVPLQQPAGQAFFHAASSLISLSRFGSAEAHSQLLELGNKDQWIESADAINRRDLRAR